MASKLSDLFKGYTGLSLPGVNFTPVTRTLPGGDTYQSPILNRYVGQTPLQGAIANMPAPVVPTTPAQTSRPTAQTQPTQPVQTQESQTYKVPPQYINPKTGGLYSKQEFAEILAKSIPGGGADVAAYAGNAMVNPNQTTEQLMSSASGMNNVRNDIATGTTDPYNAASKSGIPYSPADLKAIENAYAGIYDPALKDVFSKLETKQKEEELKAQQDFEMQKLAKQHEYTMAEKAVTDGGIGGVYTPGANPQVDAMAELIWNGKATMASVPKNYKMQVASAMQSYGNQINGRPTTTEIGKQKLTAAKKLLTMFDKGDGTSVVGQSRLFGGWIATPGSKGADFYSLADQLMAIAQLDASKFLKGQGQVSDAERAILMNAATSLKYNQSEELFRKTLTEMIGALEGNIPPEQSGTTGGVLRSPDGSQEVSISDLTPAELAEAKAAGWQ